MTRPLTTGSGPLPLVSGLLALCVLASAPPLLAATVGDRYSDALSHERGLRTPVDTPATLAELRRGIERYEAIVRDYPRSGYSDNALWQAAGLAVEAYVRYGDDADRVRGERLLEALSREYPFSPLVPRVAIRLAALSTPDRVEPARPGVVRLRSVSRETLPDLVRVTLELEAEVQYVSDHLNGPARLYFDLADTDAAAPLVNATLPYQDGDIVREIRLGRHPGHTTRVVIDVEGVESYNVYPMYDPYRLVIDSVRMPAFASLAAVSTPTAPGLPDARQESGTPYVRAAAAPVVLTDAPLVNVDGAYSLARQLGLGISRVVIDPGHGGYDPGARSGDLTESGLVMDVAERLESKLLEAGIEVVLTRRGDVYMPLRARTELANRVQADLFLSIHANASDDPQLRGVETYHLDFATDPTAQALAARENAGGGESMHELTHLVQTIAMNNKEDESRELAALVQRNLVAGVRQSLPNAPDLGVKQAPFMVLIGATMPSVLTEISFLTNEETAAHLATDAYRDQIAESLFLSLVSYQDTLTPNTRIARER
ncbi:MAG: N-acetylmuramoyl-L-alanine amidase [Acidobacteria bacterium]|nr:N-acetylmuramoyl-L-alanine amidase [Acidobacteriota bacterium]